jgi:hypothetical protein
VGIGTASPAVGLHVLGGARILTLAVHANNAAALSAGKVAGDLYRSSTGQVFVVY